MNLSTIEDAIAVGSAVLLALIKAVQAGKSSDEVVAAAIDVLSRAKGIDADVDAAARGATP